MQELYQERILELARSSKHSKPIDNPTHRAEKNNPICGDKVIINVIIKDNLVYDAHLIVRGCALCEAGAGIWKETAVGREINELNLLRDDLDNFLKNKLIIISSNLIYHCNSKIFFNSWKSQNFINRNYL